MGEAHNYKSLGKEEKNSGGPRLDKKIKGYTGLSEDVKIQRR